MTLSPGWRVVSFIGLPGGHCSRLVKTDQPHKGKPAGCNPVGVTLPGVTIRFCILLMPV